MSGKRAKRIRREVYGDLSLKGRRYFRNPAGTIRADKKRLEYQKAKKEYLYDKQR